MYQISFGGFSFDDNNISSGSIAISNVVDLPGDELCVDTFTAVVSYEEGEGILWSPKDYDGILTADGLWFAVGVLTGDITAVPYGTELTFVHGEITERYYIKNVVRMAKALYKINAISAIGLLDGQTFRGGIYENAMASDVIDAIVGGVFSYTVAADVASQTVSGWIPICTRREALHQFMFAMGVSLTKDADGGISFVFLRGQDTKHIPDSRLYLGGDMDYNTPVTAVNVTEHQYIALAGDTVDVLFTNVDEAAANNALIEFSEPYHDIAVTGLTLVESGVNYAIVSGNGTLTGKRYTHNTRVIRRENGYATGEPKTASSAEDYLVNFQNSENVAKRLLSFYSSRRTVNASLVVADEQSGDMVSFTDAFGNATTGFISSMDIVGSSFMKAACSIIVDYLPQFFGNYYTNRIVVDSSGSVTLPSGVTHIRLVLIAGGDGGDGGYDGEDSATGATVRNIREPSGDVYRTLDFETQPIQRGGKAGTPGSAGKIVMVDLDVTDGETLNFTIGAAGVGGARNGGHGTAGTATSVTSPSIGSLSSDDGKVYDAFPDPLTGEVYGKPGTEGQDGGTGGRTGFYGNDAGDGDPGGSVGNRDGGQAGDGASDTDYPRKYQSFGGGGGGASNDADGGDAGDGSVTQEGGVYHLYGGDAGNGADAETPATPTYGCGGAAGNGGGAAGNPGGARFLVGASGIYYLHLGASGVGGKGSAGGNGGAGAGLIFY